MPTYSFVTLNVFTGHRFGGDPLAVFPDASGLSSADMQALATEFDLSETIFVLPPDDSAHTARVRIFRPTHELPFAGHLNIGTGFVLAQAGRDRGGALLFEEKAGPVEVLVNRDSAGVVTGATIAAPQPLSLGTELPAEAVAACAGLSPADVLLAAHRPVLASVGTPFVIAEVSRNALSRAAPNAAAFRRALAGHPGLGGKFALHLYSHDGPRLRARLFAPLSGIADDPSTGGANTPLAALLLSLNNAAEYCVDVVQGVERGRSSLLHVTARRGPDGIRAAVGGNCVPVLQGEATI